MSLYNSKLPLARPPTELIAQPNLTPPNYKIPSSPQPEFKRSMGAEQSSKRTYDQIVAEIEAGESSQYPSERPHHQNDTKMKIDEPSKQATESAPETKDAETETEVGGSSQQATTESGDRAEVETEVGESSKRPCLDERRLLDSRGFTYMRRKDHKAIRPSRFNFDRSRLLDPKSFLFRQPEHCPPKAFPPSRINSNRPSKPSPTAPLRPTFDQLMTDSQQGMKVLFFVDHATKGDAIHHNLKKLIAESSSDLKLLMSKCHSDRSHHQNRFFAKARTICAQLTSRREFLELDAMESNRASRLAYFSEKCTKARLSTLYSHIGSAVDVPKILGERTPNEKAFKNLMVQVFIHSMEDLWCFEFHPSKQDLPAKIERENKEDVYNRFRELTDRVNGLPAARRMPGYLDVPLRANFPRYVLFDQGPMPRNEENVYESEEDDDGGDRGDIPHIPAE